MRLTEKQQSEGWRIVKFGDVAQEVIASTKDVHGEGIERYVGLRHIDPESLRLTRHGSIAEDNPTFTKKFSAGDILFGRRRAYLKKATVADFGGICSGDIIVIVPKGDDLVLELLPFIVQSEPFFDWAIMHSAGGLSPRTKFKSLAEFKFSLPPRPRQEEMLEGFEMIEDNLFHYEQALFQAERTLSALRYEKMINRNQGEKLVSISSLADVNPRCPPNKQRPITFCDMAALDTDSKTISGKLIMKEKSSGTKFMNGDVLFARITPSTENGKLAVVDFLKNGETGYGSTEFIVLRGNKVEPLYLYHLCRTRTLRHYAIDRMIGTSGRLRVPKEVFDEIMVPLPSKSEQQKVLSVLESIEAQKDSIKSSINSLINVRSKNLKSVLGGREHERI